MTYYIGTGIASGIASDVITTNLVAESSYKLTIDTAFKLGSMESVVKYMNTGITGFDILTGAKTDEGSAIDSGFGKCLVSCVGYGN